MRPDWNIVARFWLVAALIGATLGLVVGCGPSPSDAQGDVEAYCAYHGGVDHIEYDAGTDIVESYYKGECVDGSTVEN